MKLDNTLFIEYFITGGLAILWVVPLINFIGISPEILKLESNTILVSISITYILGMFIDYFAATILSYQKNQIRKQIFSSKGLGKYNFHKILFLVTKSENDLFLKHLERRNSRVRYARGAFMNVLLTTIVLLVSRYLTDNTSLKTLMIQAVLLSVISFGLYKMWVKMLKLSYDYQVEIIKDLNNKDNLSHN